MVGMPHLKYMCVYVREKLWFEKTENLKIRT